MKKWALLISMIFCPLAASATDWQDDSYVGLQLSLPLSANSANQGATISAILLNQRDGYHDGLMYSIGEGRQQTLNYLRPVAASAQDTVVGSIKPRRMLRLYQSSGVTAKATESDSMGTGGVLLIALGVGLILYEITEDEVETRVQEITGN